MQINYETAKYHPQKHHNTDAAWDIHTVEDVKIPARGWITVHTGLRISIPTGYAGLILSRSGLATRGIYVINAPGLIDAGYTGEVKVVLGNLHELSDFDIMEGTRIAQLMIVRLEDYFLSAGMIVGGTRGDNGFGSTGD